MYNLKMWPRSALHSLVGRGLDTPARVLQAEPVEDISGSCAKINLRTHLTLQVQ